MASLSPTLSINLPKHSQTHSHQPSPDAPSKKFNTLLQTSQTFAELTQIHSLLIKTSQIQYPSNFTELFYSYASLLQPDSLSYVEKLFTSPENPKNSFIYNTLIKCYTKIGKHKMAFLIFNEMLCDDIVKPDDFTYTFVCNACSKAPCLVLEGKQVHGLMVKSLSKSKIQSWNSLMSFYVKIEEDIEVLQRILNYTSVADTVSWNCLLDWFAKKGNTKRAQILFDEMPQKDVVSWTTMLVCYCNCGSINEARRLFDEMPEKGMISWSAMIKGYLKAEKYGEALALFRKMQTLSVKIDHVTLTTLLSVCARLGALEQGRWIHAYINSNNKLKIDAHLCTALVDMYAKCGQIDVAYKLFSESKDKDKAFIWNAMLGGFAMHSLGKKTLLLFSQMLETGMKPNEITFVCVLSACSHSRLVDEGLQVFRSMEKEHQIVPNVEHYNCIVDLLARAGKLHDAKKFLDVMPFEADANVLRALLSACRIHGDFEMGEKIGRKLVEVEPYEDGNYVLLSNVYAMDNRWKDVTELRNIMMKRGVSKSPGWSSIEVDGAVHTFVAGDDSNERGCVAINYLETKPNST